jgi:hypothetical protein
MPSPELEAFWRLDELGLILTGEYFSPFKAGRGYYSELLEAYLAKRNSLGLSPPALRSAEPRSPTSSGGASSPDTETRKRP